MNTLLKRSLLLLCLASTGSSLIADVTEDNILLYCAHRNQARTARDKTVINLTRTIALGGALFAGLAANRRYHLDPLKSAIAAASCGITLYQAGQTILAKPYSWLARWLNTSHLWWTGKRTLARNQSALLKRNFRRGDFNLNDLNNPAYHAHQETIDHLRTDLQKCQQNLQPQDFLRKPKARAGALQPPVLRAILRLTDPERFAHLPQGDSGMVFSGPGGTGKTTMAAQIAALTQAYYMPKKIADLQNMYVGESEKKIQNLFVDARAYRDQLNNLPEIEKHIMAIHQQETAAWAKLQLDLMQIQENIFQGLPAGLNEQARQQQFDQVLNNNHEYNEKIQIVLDWERARNQESLIREQHPHNYALLPAHQAIRHQMEALRPELLLAAGMEHQQPVFHPICIIFVDEFDGIGRRNNVEQHGGGAVGNKMVGTLLSELDGDNKDLQGVWFIGATNRVDLIDENLLRPGRLNAPVEINLPTEAGRRQLFRLFGGSQNEDGIFPVEDEVRNNYEGNAAHAGEPDHLDLVGATANFSQVQIKNLFQIAGERAALRNADARRITMLDMDIVLRNMLNDIQRHHRPVNA